MSSKVKFTKYKLTARRSKTDSRDFLFETLAQTVRSVTSTLPKTVDLRDKLSIVMDQGVQGSCAACTATAMKEWQECRDLKLRDKFSAQYVYNNRSNFPKEGMYGRNVMDILLKQGCCREHVYPYGVKIEGPTKITKKVHQKAKNYRIQAYARVETINGLKKALYENGPCYISFPVYNYSTTFWRQNSPNDKITGGHAVAVVGYDDNKKHFILRNSWSLLWGKLGHTYFPYEEFGKQWEVWTAIDAKSNPPEPKPNCSQCVIL